MKQQKIDAVIEAVRYDANGRIVLARMYERRGSVWSDRLLVDRKQLSKRIKQGRRLVTGTRKPYFGNMFDTGHPVHLLGEHIVTRDRSSGRDHLTGIPGF